MDSRTQPSADRYTVADMTRHRHAVKRPKPATVYDEPIEELLPAFAAIVSGGEVLPAAPECGQDEDMLSISLTLPPSAGGSVRRAVLRSQADMLRRQADAVGARAPRALCQHCRESEAMRAVAEELQRVARRVGVMGSTVAERALLLGQLTSAAPCRCRAIS